MVGDLAEQHIVTSDAVQAGQRVGDVLVRRDQRGIDRAVPLGGDPLDGRSWEERRAEPSHSQGF